ncbi:MAG: hypothetical protein ABF289_12345 [Clostridiales bacterium]
MKKVMLFIVGMILSICVGIFVPKMSYEAGCDVEWNINKFSGKSHDEKADTVNIENDSENIVESDNKISQNNKYTQSNKIEEDNDIESNSDKNVADISSSDNSNLNSNEKNSQSLQYEAEELSIKNEDSSDSSEDDISEDTEKYSSDWIELQIEKHSDEIDNNDLSDFRRIIVMINQSYIASMAQDGFDSEEQEKLKNHLTQNLSQSDYSKAKILFYKYDYLLDAE